MRPVHKLLIRGTNWIGDCVMSLAAIRELRRLYPHAHVTLLVKGWVAGLFESQGLVDEVLAIADSGVLEQSRLIRPRSFDLGVLFPNSFSSAATMFFSRIPERAGYRTDLRRLFLTRSGLPRVKKREKHQAFYYLDILYQCGLSDVNYLDLPEFSPDIQLSVSSSGRAEAASGLEGLRGPLVVVNPGAFYGSAKRWFSDRYATLGDWLGQELGASVVLVGSPGELTLAQKISQKMTRSPRVLTGSTSLASLMGILARADLFITNDSGPMHLAAALGTPQIALFGSTDEVATGPLSDQATVIHKHAACSPCLLRECPIDLRCFDRISVEEVSETARSILAGQSAKLV